MAHPSPPPRSALETLAKAIVWSVVGLFGVVLFLAMVLPQGCAIPRFVAHQSQCRNNLRMLGIAMHSYHDAYGSFSPAYLADGNGKPMHSWRVLLLPYMDQGKLYQEYHFDEPWNGPHNQLLASRMPREFSLPCRHGFSHRHQLFCRRRAEDGFPRRGAYSHQGHPRRHIEHNSVGRGGRLGVNWLEPRDLSYVEAVRGLNPKSGWGISSHHPEGAEVALADGSVWRLSEATPGEQLRRLLERNDGLPVSWP
jgi:hypothetical protein